MQPGTYSSHLEDLSNARLAQRTGIDAEKRIKIAQLTERCKALKGRMQETRREIADSIGTDTASTSTLSNNPPAALIKEHGAAAATGPVLGPIYKDFRVLADTAKIRLDSLESELERLDKAETAEKPQEDSRKRGIEQNSLQAATQPHAASVHDEEDTDTEQESFLVDTVVLAFSYIAFLIRSTEDLERFAAILQKHPSKASPLFRIFVTVDGSAVSHHVLDVTDQMISEAITGGTMMCETFVPSGSDIGDALLVRIPVQVPISLPYREGAGLCINLSGRIPTNAQYVLNPVHMVAKAEMPAFMRSPYENTIHFSNMHTVCGAYVTVGNSLELLYDSGAATMYGVQLSGILGKSTIKNANFVAKHDFVFDSTEMLAYPISVGFKAFACHGIDGADNFHRQVQGRRRLMDRIRASSEILRQSANLLAVEKADFGVYTFEDSAFLQTVVSASRYERGQDRLLKDRFTGEFFTAGPAKTETSALPQTPLNVPSEKHDVLPPTFPPATSISSVQPVLYISRLELRCLPRTIHSIKLSVSFGRQQAAVACDSPVPVTAGHAILPNIVVTFPVNVSATVPYVEFRVDGFSIEHELIFMDTCVVSLESLFARTSVEDWADLRQASIVGSGRGGSKPDLPQLYCKLACLPTIGCAGIDELAIMDSTGKVWDRRGYELLQERWSGALQQERAGSAGQYSLQPSVGLSASSSSTVAPPYARTEYEHLSILDVITEATSTINTHLQNISTLDTATAAGAEDECHDSKSLLPAEDNHISSDASSSSEPSFTEPSQGKTLDTEQDIRHDTSEPQSSGAYEHARSLVSLEARPRPRGNYSARPVDTHTSSKGLPCRMETDDCSSDSAPAPAAPAAPTVRPARPAPHPAASRTVSSPPSSENDVENSDYEAPPHKDEDDWIRRQARKIFTKGLEYSDSD